MAYTIAQEDEAMMIGKEREKERDVILWGGYGQ